MTHTHVYEGRHSPWYRWWQRRGTQGDYLGSLQCKCGRIKIYERPAYLQPMVTS